MIRRVFNHVLICGQFSGVLSFHNVDPRDQIQAVRLGGRHIYLLSHLSRPTQKVCDRLFPWDSGWMSSKSQVMERLRKCNHHVRREGILRETDMLLRQRTPRTGVSLGVSHWRRKSGGLMSARGDLVSKRGSLYC